MKMLRRYCWANIYEKVGGSMLAMAEKTTDYTNDSRLTEPSDGKRYEWRKMIELSKKLGRPLTEEEAEEFRVK